MPARYLSEDTEEAIMSFETSEKCFRLELTYTVLFNHLIVLTCRTYYLHFIEEKTGLEKLHNLILSIMKDSDKNKREEGSK